MQFITFLNFFSVYIICEVIQVVSVIKGGIFVYTRNIVHFL